MMQIGRMRVNDADDQSLRNQLLKKHKASGSNDAQMNKLFPIANGLSSRAYNEMQMTEKHRNHKLSQQDLKDFRVPIKVCADYSVVLRPTKELLRTIVMGAMGISTFQKQAKISYEQFLKLNSFLLFNNGSPEDYMWFCVRLFDPQIAGFTKHEDCERVIDLLFDNQDESGNTTKPPAVNLPQQMGSKKVSIMS